MKSIQSKANHCKGELVSECNEFGDISVLYHVWVDSWKYKLNFLSFVCNYVFHLCVFMYFLLVYFPVENGKIADITL